MALFDKTRFTGSNFVMYDGRFVARFRRGGRADFLKFLVKNFTVEEYFGKLEGDRLSPLEILEERGYLSPTVRKVLREMGYPETVAGKQQYLADALKQAAGA